MAVHSLYKPLTHQHAMQLYGIPKRTKFYDSQILIIKPINFQIRIVTRKDGL